MNPLPARRPLDLKATLLVLVLCTIWGCQQVVMKAVAADVAPTMQLAVRFVGAAIFFGVWVFRDEGPAAFVDGALRSGVLLGLMFALEFLLVGEALVYTSAAHTMVFLYSAPVFTALGLQFLPEERLRWLQWAGIGLAFAGIVVAFLGQPGGAASGFLGGDLLALMAGACWGLTNVVLRRGRIGHSTTQKTIFYQVAIAAVLLLAFAAKTGQTRITPSPAAILALLYHTLVISIISYLIWFWLLRHYLASRLMLLSLLTPILGVTLSALLLGEPIGARFGAGALLVLAGILGVNARQLLQRSS
jgi:drug/metabolite transporter (DMT)-like permease